MLLENGADRLARCRVATNLKFVKNTISAKRNKTRFVCVVCMSWVLTGHETKNGCAGLQAAIYWDGLEFKKKGVI
jgi:hypothetical protein